MSSWPMIAQAFIEQSWQIRIIIAALKDSGFWCTICLGGTVSASVHSLENSESGEYQGNNLTLLSPL